MIKYLYILTILLTFSNAGNTNNQNEEVSNPSFSFTTRQDLLEQVKLVIQDEESIAKAYEEYILNEYKRPESIDSLLNNLYLGRSFSKVSRDSTNFNDFKLDSSINFMDYSLKSSLMLDVNIRSLYESDTFRKNTFFYDDKIYIILKEDLSKNIYNLITSQDNALKDCDDELTRYCIKDGHIYIYETIDTSKAKGSRFGDLMIYYFIDNFQSGPIIIKDDISYFSKDEFKNLPLGSKLYDFKGVKYIKIDGEIRKLN